MLVEVNTTHPFCQCLHEIENGLPRTQFCFVACSDQRQILRERMPKIDLVRNTVAWQLAQLTQDERNAVVANSETSRLVEYANKPCYTVGMALCYLFDWGTSHEAVLGPEHESLQTDLERFNAKKAIGVAFWTAVANKYSEIKYRSL